MSGNDSFRRGFRNQRQNKHQGNKNEKPKFDESNPVLVNFKKYAQELDAKHDRYERIVKLGRDVTIESKRIIFLLHTIDPKKENKEKVLKEAEKRLLTLCEVNFLNIAKELRHLDPYQYARAYSPGLQEFVEAFTFYEYLSGRKMSNWKCLQEKLNYEVKSEIEGEAEDSKDIKEVSCLVQPLEFILGLADTSGEVMRKCINSLGSGDIDSCFESCRIMQSLYASFLSIGFCRNRELNRKIYTLHQSVLKTENVCYNVKVRGGEAAKWGTVGDGFGEKNFEDDEGFF